MFSFSNILLASGVLFVANVTECSAFLCSCKSQPAESGDGNSGDGNSGEGSSGKGNSGEEKSKVIKSEEDKSEVMKSGKEKSEEDKSEDEKSNELKPEEEKTDREKVIENRFNLMVEKEKAAHEWRMKQVKLNQDEKKPSTKSAAPLTLKRSKSHKDILSQPKRTHKNGDDTVEEVVLTTFVRVAEAMNSWKGIRQYEEPHITKQQKRYAQMTLTLKKKRNQIILDESEICIYFGDETLVIPANGIEFDCKHECKSNRGCLNLWIYHFNKGFPEVPEGKIFDHQFMAIEFENKSDLDRWSRGQQVVRALAECSSQRIMV